MLCVLHACASCILVSVLDVLGSISVRGPCTRTRAVFCLLFAAGWSGQASAPPSPLSLSLPPSLALFSPSLPVRGQSYVSWGVQDTYWRLTCHQQGSSCNCQLAVLPSRHIPSNQMMRWRLETPPRSGVQNPLHILINAELALICPPTSASATCVSVLEF
jgi:hypothetical protein